MDIMQIFNLARNFTPESILSMSLKEILEVEHISELLPPAVLSSLSQFPDDAKLSDIPAPALGVILLSSVHKYANEQTDVPEITVNADTGHFVQCKHCKRTHFYSPSRMRMINADGDKAVTCRTCAKSHVYSDPNSDQI